ncbi:MAG: hypothetical protein FWC76_04485 [Defluviitaleaceae bacterium]|nr:hypothetical protein [Defluviitaleaceae bacterium]
MTKINKKMELSCKALGAAMFMFTVCLYMAIGALFASMGGEVFNYHISFALLIQGIAVSLVASTAWVLCFSFNKPWGFFTRYIISLVALAALFVISMLIPVVNGAEGHFIWIISGIASTFVFGTAVAVSSNMHFRKTGLRSALLWEIN